MLRVPSLVNSPYTLLQYFRQSLLADNIRPLTGPHVQQTVSNYYDNIFFTQETDAVRDGTKREIRRFVVGFIYYLLRSIHLLL